MKTKPDHIETAVISRPLGASYGRMYSMHKYWDKKSPDVIAEYIKRYTDRGEIVLDPFCGSGVTAGEAIKLGRRAVAIDLNPMATFITRVTLRPVNLSRLQLAFRDVQSACEETISELFATECCKCGKRGIIDFVIRENDEPIQIAYTCVCSRDRLFKDPDKTDRHLDRASNRMEIPFWYPRNVPLPPIRKEGFEYLHELFTKRNLIALSSILNTIKSIEDERVRDLMKLAFTGALDKCSRLKPLYWQGGRPYSLREGWVAVRFYAPKKWQEVNPWMAFARSFMRVYEGKKESNALLPHAVIGSQYSELQSGNANAVILTGSAEEMLSGLLPENAIDYVLTDPPFGSSIQYLQLSRFWGAWLELDFDYDLEIVIAPHRGKTQDEYNRRMHAIFHALGRVTKPNRYVHIGCKDIKGPHLHNILNSLHEAKIIPERILHQPHPKSFGIAARARGGHYGSYLIRGRVSDEVSSPGMKTSEDELLRKVRKAAHTALAIRGGEAKLGTILHSVYQQLEGHEIIELAKYPAESFLFQSIGDFAQRRRGIVKLSGASKATNQTLEIWAKVHKAILDAKSLQITEKDIKNMVLQLVLRRFQSDGITVDDVRIVDENSTEPELKEYRKERFADLLCRFGRELGFHSVISNDTVTWSKPHTPQCSLELNDRDIRVSQLIPGEARPATWGTISYVNLERKLFEWCKGNQDKDETMMLLNPLEGPSFTVPDRNNHRPTGAQHLKLKVLQNREVCPDHYLMQLQVPRRAKLEPRPGQFFHIVCDGDGGLSRGYPLTLRRPFSVHGVQYPDFDRRLLAKAGDLPKEIREILTRWPSQMDFLYRVVGEGTKDLRLINPGTWIDVIGPNGNGFSIGSERIAVIVAGGIGAAPLVALAEQLRYFDREVHIYFGALKKELLIPAISRADSFVDFGFANDTQEFCDKIRTEFREIGAREVRICTDDGSAGEQGLVTDILERDMSSRLLPQDDICFYACGPYSMLRVIAEIAERNSINCEVLMEERMACGIGACLSCTCDIVSSEASIEKKRVCSDGPVFTAAEIKWKK